jgi:hypothetical protein
MRLISALSGTWLLLMACVASSAVTADGSNDEVRLVLQHGDVLVWRFNVSGPGSTVLAAVQSTTCASSDRSAIHDLPLVFVDGKFLARGFSYEDGRYLYPLTATDYVDVGVQGIKPIPRGETSWVDCWHHTGQYLSTERAREAAFLVFVVDAHSAYLNLSWSGDGALSNDVWVGKASLLTPTDAPDGVYASAIVSAGALVHQTLETQRDAVGWWDPGPTYFGATDASCSHNGVPCPPYEAKPEIRGRPNPTALYAKGAQTWDFRMNYSVNANWAPHWVGLVDLPGDDYLADEYG